MYIEAAALGLRLVALAKALLALSKIKIKQSHQLQGTVPISSSFTTKNLVAFTSTKFFLEINKSFLSLLLTV